MGDGIALMTVVLLAVKCALDLVRLVVELAK